LTEARREIIGMSARTTRIRLRFTTGDARNAIVHNGVLDPGVEPLSKPFTVDALGRRLNDMRRGAR
jgi:hypothetical protein